MEILKYFCNMNIKNKINNMDDAKREKLGEVIRFGIVGGLATILQYVIYLAMMPALAHFIPNMGDHSLATTANTIAYIVSFIFNFIASTRYTFKVRRMPSAEQDSPSPTSSTTRCRPSASTSS